jgi:hypothetical protein
VIDVDRALARRAAWLRARHRSLRLGDALSPATALSREGQPLTFDERLRRIAAREPHGPKAPGQPPSAAGARCRELGHHRAYRRLAGSAPPALRT